MKRLLYLLVFLLFCTNVFGQNTTSQDAPNIQRTFLGGVVISEILSIPVRDTGVAWYGKNGSIAVGTVDDMLYYHDGTKWYKIATLQDVDESGLQWSDTLTALATHTDLIAFLVGADTIWLHNTLMQHIDDDLDLDPTNELQAITRNANNLTLNLGGGTVSIEDDDSDPTNELQTIERTGTNVTLSNSGGSFSINDAD